MSIVTVAYSPNDFFYVTSNMTPTDDECKLQYSDASWNDTCTKCYEKSKNPNFTGTCDLSWNDIKTTCYNFQLCKNKEMANLANQQENKYSGSDERYANIQKQYDYAVLNTVNLVSGIAIIGYLTAFYFSKH